METENIEIEKKVTAKAQRPPRDARRGGDGALTLVGVEIETAKSQRPRRDAKKRETFGISEAGGWSTDFSRCGD